MNNPTVNYNNRSLDEDKNVFLDDTMDLETARKLLHEMIEKEYALP